MNATRLPATDEEWRDAVDLAHGFLVIDSARTYGLIVGGPIFDLSRCEEILRLGAERNVLPGDDALNKTFRTLHGG